MTRCAALLVLILLLQTSPGFGQIDPYPNGLGVYFDEAGMTNMTTASVGETVHAYLVVTNCTFPGEADFWMLYGLYVVPIGDHDPAWTFEAVPRGGGVNTIVGNISIEHHFDVVYDDAPFVFSETTVLADLYIPVVNDEPIEIFLTEPMFSTLSTGESVWLWPHYYTGMMPPPVFYVAGINADHTPVEEESFSWGDIKALYR